MTDIIKLLPDNIANQISAGEVVQRPASVVKELLENAVDAGSNELKLIIKQAGKSLIQVIDNGCGMSSTDARMSFERHATSKIQEAADLFRIRTMGFRGEALASIAAVSSVELKTKKAAEAMGSEILLEGTKVVSQGLCQTPTGTSVSVKNLFFNTPGRRKFLKSDSVELRHIREEFIRIALAHPSISMSLYSDDRMLYQLPHQKLKQRVLSIFGEEANKRIVSVEESTSELKISGFVGKPEFGRKSRREQYLFVNNRFVINYSISHSIKSAFKDLMDDAKNPFFVLFLELDPETVDINVHPTKHEIKFRDERLIYQIVLASVKHALGKNSLVPSLDFESDNRFISNAFSQSLNRPASQGALDYSAERIVRAKPNTNDPDNISRWRDLYDGLQKGVQHQDRSEPSATSMFSNTDHEDSLQLGQLGPNCIQIQASFIVCSIRSGLVVIDQQAAHERILYERIKQLKAEEKLSSQSLIFPVMLELSKEEGLLLSGMLDDINQLGFDINVFGNNSFVIHAQPAITDLNIDLESLVMEMIEQTANERKIETGLADALLKKISIHSAIKKGKLLQKEEMESLINQLFACENAEYGLREKKTYRVFELNEISNWF